MFAAGSFAQVVRTGKLKTNGIRGTPQLPARANQGATLRGELFWRALLQGAGCKCFAWRERNFRRAPIVPRLWTRGPDVSQALSTTTSTEPRTLAEWRRVFSPTGMFKS